MANEYYDDPFSWGEQTKPKETAGQGGAYRQVAGGEVSGYGTGPEAFLNWFTGAPPSVEYGQMSLWTPEQAGLFTDYLMPYLQGGISQTTPSQVSPIYNRSLSGIEKLLSGEGDLNLMSQTADTLREMLMANPQDFEDYYTKTVQQPAIEEFLDVVRPAINRQYAPSGFYSSQRLSADQRANEELVKYLGQSRAKLGYEARESALDRAVQAATPAMQLPGYEMDIFERGAGAGLGQYKYSAEYLAEQRRKERANEILQALQLAPFENIVTTHGGSSGFFGGLFGGGGGGGGSVATTGRSANQSTASTGAGQNAAGSYLGSDNAPWWAWM